MKTLVLAALGLLAAACSSSDGGASGTGVDGTWQVALANSCEGTYVFNGNKYSDNAICTLTNGDYGVQIEDGTFTTSGNDIDFVPTQSSCVSASGASTDTFSVQGQQLVLGFPQGTQVILEKVTPGTASGGAVIEDGCWDSTLTNFTPHPIQSL